MASFDGQNNYVDRWERTLGGDSDSVIHRPTIVRTRESSYQIRPDSTSAGSDSRATDASPSAASEYAVTDYDVADSGDRYVDRWEQVITVDPHEMDSGARVLVSNKHPIHSFRASRIYPSQTLHSYNIGLKERDGRDRAYSYGEGQKRGQSQNVDAEEDSDGGVQIIRKLERSFSIDEDGRKSGYSSRHLERRKTIEVNKDDLSGLEARHTSYFNFNVGSGQDQNQQGENSVVSEVNIVWGKTIDADEISSPRESERSFRSEMQFSPRMNRSLDDSTDYWSADMDMSSDTVMTSDSYNTFVETGDSLYTSDSNDSFFERQEVSPRITDSRDTSIDAKSFTVWRDGETQSTGLPFVPHNELVFTAATGTDGNPHINPEIAIETKKSSKQDTDGSERTKAFAASDDWEQELQPDKRALFKVSDTIAVLGRGSSEQRVEFGQEMSPSEQTDPYSISSLRDEGDIPFTDDSTRVDNEKYVHSGDNIEHKEWRYEFPYSDSGDQSDADTNDGEDAQHGTVFPGDTRDMQPERDSALEVGQNTEVLQSETLAGASLHQTSDDSFNLSVGDLDAINNNGTVVSGTVSQEDTGDVRVEDDATVIISGEGVSNWRTVDSTSDKIVGVDVDDRSEGFEEGARNFDQGSTQEDTHVTVESNSGTQMPKTEDTPGPAATVDKAAEETEFVPVRSKKKKKKKGKKKKQKATADDESADREEEAADTAGFPVDTQKDTFVTDPNQYALASDEAVAEMSKYAAETESHDADIDLSNVSGSVPVTSVSQPDDVAGADTETAPREEVCEPDHSAADTADINVSTDIVEVGDLTSFVGEDDAAEEHPQPVDASIMALGGPDDTVAVCEPDDSSVDVCDVVVSDDVLDIADTTPEMPGLGDSLAATSVHPDVAPVTSDDHEAERLLNERTDAEEFIAKILDETDARSLEQGNEFLHSDEPSGVLLNMYTGGHRRILKPHRRFTKPPEESSSVDENAPVTPLEDAQKDLDRIEGTSVDVIPLDSTAIAGSDVKGTDLHDKGEPKKKKGDKARKRKRDGTSRLEVPPDDEDSELNISGESGSLDASHEETEDMDALEYLRFLEDQEEENITTFADQRSTLSDEFEQMQVEDDDNDRDIIREEIFPAVEREDNVKGETVDEPTELASEDETSYDISDIRDDLIDASGERRFTDQEEKETDITVEHESEIDRMEDIIDADPAEYIIIIKGPSHFGRLANRRESMMVEQSTVIIDVKESQVEDADKEIAETDRETAEVVKEEYTENVDRGGGPDGKDTDENAALERVSEDADEENVIEDSGGEVGEIVDNEQIKPGAELYARELQDDPLAPKRQYQEMEEAEHDQKQVIQRGDSDIEQSTENVAEQWDEEDGAVANYMMSTERETDRVEEFLGEPGPEKATVYRRMSSKTYDENMLISDQGSTMVVEHSDVVVDVVQKNEEDYESIREEESSFHVAEEDRRINESDEEDEERKDSDIKPVEKEEDGEDTGSERIEPEEESPGQSGEESDVEDEGEDDTVPERWDDALDDEPDRNTDVVTGRSMYGESQVTDEIRRFGIVRVDNAETEDIEYNEEENVSERWDEEEDVSVRWNEEVENKEMGDMVESKEMEEGEVEETVFQEDKFLTEELERETDRAEQFIRQSSVDTIKFFRPESVGDLVPPVAWADQPEVLPGIIYEGSHTEEECLITGIREEVAGDDGGQDRRVTYDDEEESGDRPGERSENEGTQEGAENVVHGEDWGAVGDSLEMKTIEADLVEMIDNDEKGDEKEYNVDLYNDEEKETTLGGSEYSQKEVRNANVIQDSEGWTDSTVMQNIEETLTELIDEPEEEDAHDNIKEAEDTEGSEKSWGEAEDALKVLEDAITEKDEELKNVAGMRDIAEKIVEMIEEDEENAAADTELNDVDEVGFSHAWKEQKGTELGNASAMSELNYLRGDVTEINLTEERLYQMIDEGNEIWGKEDDEKKKLEITMKDADGGSVVERVDEDLAVLKDEAGDTVGNLSITHGRTEVTEEDKAVDEEEVVVCEPVVEDVTAFSEEKETEENTAVDVTEGESNHEKVRHESETDRVEEFMDMVAAESIHFSRPSGSVEDHVSEEETYNTMFVEVSDDVSVITKGESDTEDIENENVDGIYKDMGYDGRVNMEEGDGEDYRNEREKELDGWEDSEEWEDETKVKEESVTEDVEDLYDRDDERGAVEEYEDSEVGVTEIGDDEDNAGEKNISDKETHSVPETDRTEEFVDDEETVKLLRFRSFDENEESLSEENIAQDVIEENEQDAEWNSNRQEIKEDTKYVDNSIVVEDERYMQSESVISDVGRSEGEKEELSSVSEADNVIEPEKETDRLEEFLDTKVAESITVVKEKREDDPEEFGVGNLMFVEKPELVVEEAAGEEVEEEGNDRTGHEIEHEVKRYREEEDEDVQITEKSEVSTQRSEDRDVHYRVNNVDGDDVITKVPDDDGYGDTTAELKGASNAADDNKVEEVQSESKKRKKKKKKKDKKKKKEYEGETSAAAGRKEHLSQKVHVAESIEDETSSQEVVVGIDTTGRDSVVDYCGEKVQEEGHEIVEALEETEVNVAEERITDDQELVETGHTGAQYERTREVEGNGVEWEENEVKSEEYTEVVNDNVAVSEEKTEVVKDVESADGTETDVEIANVTENYVEIADVTEKDIEIANVTEKDVEIADVTEKDLEVADVTERGVEIAEVPEADAENAGLMVEDSEDADATENVDWNLDLFAPDVTEKGIEIANVTEKNFEVADVTEKGIEIANVTEKDVEVADVTERGFEIAEVPGADVENAGLMVEDSEDADATENVDWNLDLFAPDVTEKGIEVANVTEKNFEVADVTEKGIEIANVTEKDVEVADVTEKEIKLGDVTDADVENAGLAVEDSEDADATENVDWNVDLFAPDVTEKGVEVADVKDVEITDMTERGAETANVTEKDVEIADVTEEDVEISDVTEKDDEIADVTEADVENAGLSVEDSEDADTTENVDWNLDLFAPDVTEKDVEIANVTEREIELADVTEKGVEIAAVTEKDDEIADVTEADVENAGLSVEDSEDADTTENVDWNLDLFAPDVTEKDVEIANVTEREIELADVTEKGVEIAAVTEKDDEIADVTEADVENAGLLVEDSDGADTTENVDWNVDLFAPDMTEKDVEIADVMEKGIEIADVAEADVENAGLTMEDSDVADATENVGWNLDLFAPDVAEKDVEIADVKDVEITDMAEKGIEIANVTEKDVEVADVTEKDLEVADMTERGVKIAEVPEADAENAGLMVEDSEDADTTENVDWNLDLFAPDVTEKGIEIANVTEKDVEVAEVTEKEIKLGGVTDADVENAGLAVEDIDVADGIENVDWNLDLFAPDMTEKDVEIAGVKDVEITDMTERGAEIANVTEKEIELADVVEKDFEIADVAEADVENAGLTVEDSEDADTTENVDWNFDLFAPDEGPETQDFVQSIPATTTEDKQEEETYSRTMPDTDSILEEKDSTSSVLHMDENVQKVYEQPTDSVSFVSPEEEATPVLVTGENVEEKPTESKKKKKKKKRDKKKDKARQEELAVPLHDSDKTPEPSAHQAERSVSELPGDAHTSESVNEMREVEGASVQVEKVQICRDDIGPDKEVDIQPVVAGEALADVNDDSDVGNVNENRTVSVVDSSIINYQMEQLPAVFVDRHEEFLQDYIPTTVTGRLLEDVVSNRARAEEVIAQNPEASQGHVIHDSSSSSEATLTPAGHLMSEMSLLETAARDQWESLQLAVSEQEKYEQEIRHNTTAISEAQQKLQASPEMATSVGALKQQMAEHNNLTAQIKQYQTKVNEINEKSRQLALDSAQLSPNVFRKHYHPESAYSDYFAATAQHKRTASPLPTSANLFYEHLPTFDSSPASVGGPNSTITADTKQTLSSLQPLEPRGTPLRDMPSLSLELPKKIPPPKTDSIPRPTWSDGIPSTVAMSSEPVSTTSLSQSLESPRTAGITLDSTNSSPRSYVTPPTSARSMEAKSTYMKRLGTPYSSSIMAEAGPRVSQSLDTPASSRETISFDSGLDSGANVSSYLLQAHPSPSSSIGSMGEKLTSMNDSRPKKPPPGGRPTEILRLQGSNEQIDSQHTTSMASIKSDDTDILIQQSPFSMSQSTVMSPRSPSLMSSQSTLVSPRLQALSGNWKSASESNLTSSPLQMKNLESPRFGAASATSTPRTAKVITGTLVIGSPRTETKTDPPKVDPWASLELDPLIETSTSGTTAGADVDLDETLTTPPTARRVMSKSPDKSTENRSPRAVSFKPKISSPTCKDSDSSAAKSAKPLAGILKPGSLAVSKSDTPISTQFADFRQTSQSSEPIPKPHVSLSTDKTTKVVTTSAFSLITSSLTSSSVTKALGAVDTPATTDHGVFTSVSTKFASSTTPPFVGRTPRGLTSGGAGKSGLTASFDREKGSLKPVSLEPEGRERSSSFGAEVGPVGRPLGQAQAVNRVRELDISWNTLQEQGQSKERELQAALQRQERYQLTIQEVTAKMERAHIRLAHSPAAVAAPLDVQMKEYRDTLVEIENIKADIAKARDMGQQLVDTPSAEGHKAMEATLTMLADRFDNLQAMAEDKGRQLQEAMKNKEKHNIAEKAYKKRVQELHDWLEEKKVRQASITLPSEDPVTLQTQLDENREIQEEINNYLRQVSDLALQCDSLCENETPVTAEKLRNELATLQNDLGQFKIVTIEKQSQLRAAIKDAEKRRKERAEHDSNVQRLQKWMSDTKELTMASGSQATAIAPGQRDIHKDLATDISKHRQLVRQISGHKLRAATSTTASDREVRESWERLSRDLAQKKQNLETILKSRKPGERVQISLHAPARHADSARQLEEVKSVMSDMGDCWNQLQVQLEAKQLQLDEALTFQQQYQSALQNVSSWLDLAQQQLFTVPSTTEEHIRQNENLQRQIRSLHGEVSSMSEQAEDLLAATNSANKDLIEKCLGSLNDRVKLLEDTAQTQAEDLHRAERQWKQYQDEVAELQRRLQDTQKLVLAPASTQTLEQLMSNNQKIEAQLKKCETQLEELKGKESNLTQAYPKGVFPSELSTLQSNYMELHRRAMEKKATLQNTVSVQDQYQKMLKDYAVFLETGQEKLRNDSISARDLNHLKQQLAAHKDFFSDLEVHKAMLDSLAGQCDPATRAKFQQQHSSLSNLTHVLVDQASLHGQRLERLTRQWIELDEKYMRLIKVLSSLESQVPRPIVSGDSLTTIQDKLGKYKRLQSELADERNMVFDVVDRGKQILHSINCPTLETAVTDLANKWVSLNTDLTHELKRTETLGDQLSVFETEAAVLTSWLNAAKMKLASFKQLSPSDLQNIGAIRTKVEKVLEFWKEVENQLPLKNRVITVGNQLLQNKNYDTRGLSDRLNGYELEWVQLEKGIAESQEFLHQAQMDLMPSRQALNELTSWIEEINQSLQQDANKRITTVADIELMLKKYKGYKIELASKQMTLDFVNQEVLAPHHGEIDVPHEKFEFAEKLGDLNKRWKKVVKDVNDRLNVLEGLQSKWEEYEKALERLQTWFHEQEDKIKRYKLIGQEVGVRQTQKDCKAMHDQLQAKQSDLDAIRKLGKHLIELSRESPGCQQSVKESLATLEENWRRLEEQTRQLEILLTDMLGQWARYHTDLAVLNKVITQTEYALNHYTLIGGDIATLRSQVDKLKALQAELNNNSGHLESFSALASQLRQVCEPPVQVEIQKTVSDIQTKFKQLKSDLAARCNQFDSCLNQWQEYENQYCKIREWLDAKEILCTELINMRDDPRRRPESLAKSNQLLQELDSIQGQISNLYRLSDQLTKNMNPSTIAIITHHQSTIEQRMMDLRQILAQHKSTLTDDLSQEGRFNEAFEVVRKFLSYAEAILLPEDPTKAAEETEIQSRLDQLKQLVLLFNTNYSKLDDVNDLGYRLALNEADATRLRELNHNWQNLYEDACDRSRTLQGILLVMQDFTSKCEHWMAFLAQTEQDLAKEIKGNLRDLRDQLGKCEQFESDLYSRQQILHAIISDGQKMMRAGEVEDEEEFQQKLQLLAEQWQSVSRRANQRKVIIEGTISQWQQFNSLSKQLLDWLQGKEDAMSAYEFDSDSLQVIRNLIEKVQTTKHEFKLQEATFKKIHDLGNTLLQHADDRAADEVKDTLTELQRRWYQVFNQLDDHRARLDGVDRRWLECEDEIEDLLNWLKDIRSILHADIPTTYDEIQADMVRCRDIATDFMNAEGKRQRLLAKEKQLGRMVQTEDMNLLHQRIRLLNKQWEELQHQTHIREQRLTEALFRWTNLGERLKSLMDWIDDMEIKVISNKDMQVEDLLAKLENEYKKDMEEKEVLKDEIIEQGRQLMKVSSEIRASDIEQKLLRLEDKWNRLKGVMDFRQRKLQETVLAVKQLDISMKNLSRWLSAVENELSGGLSFRDCGLREIQAKLQDSQELQEDIERHSAGVSAVLNLCEVLLHDSDACPTETEFMALQHAMKNLEKRWRNICALSPQRRTRVEETWELWEIFREDCQRFSDWLTQTELEVHDSEIEIPDIKVAREEMQKYEVLQRNVHDHLSDLEHINRQYRQLAKEGRTDTDGSLKVKMTELNNRWDALQLRVTEIMKRLRHSPSIREDFETTRTSLITWLTEVDVQLTSLLQYSTYDLETKVTEIRRIEDEIHTKRHRMEYLDQAAVYLMQKGDSHEALTVQRELDEFRAYSKTVLDRVVTTQLYIERIVVAQVEDISTIFGDGEGASFRSAADRIREVRDAQATIDLDRQTQELERYLEQSPPESPPVKHRPDTSPSRVSLSPSRRTSSPIRRAGSPVRRSESPSPLRSRSPTRSAVTTTRGSTSPIRRFSPSPSRRSPSPTRRVGDVTDGGASPRHDLAQLERSAKIEVLMEQLVESLEDTNIKLVALEKAMGPYGDSAHCISLLMDCEVAVDDVLRLHRLLKTEAGYTAIATADTEVKLIQQRWEHLQRRALEQENRTSQERHDLVKFANDIESMLIWLDEAEALQSTHRPSSSDIAQLNTIIRQYKDFLVQIEVKKATVVSINLLSKKYLSAKTAETRQLKGKLNEMNRRWELVLSRATRIQQDLQTSLIQCQGFHHTINDYQLWLDAMETKVHRCEPINLSADESALWEKYSILMDLQGELECNQPKILSLKETADQLLVSTESAEMSTARDKTYILYNRLRTLMHLTTSYISSLESKLQVVPPKRGSASSSFDLSEGRSSGLGSSHPSRSSTPLRSGPPSLRSRNRSPFAISRQLFSGIMGPLLRSGTQDRDNLSTEHEAAATVAHQVRPGLLMRVIRAALPFQLLLLLLLLLACLLPVCEDDYNCLLSNNLQHSISPMLRYTDGAPPT